jgi:hypothetical protein
MPTTEERKEVRANRPHRPPALYPLSDSPRPLRPSLDVDFTSARKEGPHITRRRL